MRRSVMRRCLKGLGGFPTSRDGFILGPSHGTVGRLDFFPRDGSVVLNIKYRIVMWAGAGFLVAGFWALYLFPTAPIPIASAEAMWTLARLTCPVVFASFYFHFPLGVYWAILANAATYALAGLTVETLRRQLKRAN